ncbi:unnamed protein product [Gordionus sp. m RMFG-2023]
MENLLDLICIEECNIDVDENLILPISPKAKKIQLKASTSKLNPNRLGDEVVTEDSTVHNDITKYLNLKISIEEEDILQKDVLLWQSLLLFYSYNKRTVSNPISMCCFQKLLSTSRIWESYLKAVFTFINSISSPGDQYFYANLRLVD